jgi:hypothetical protein
MRKEAPRALNQKELHKEDKKIIANPNENF